MPTRIIQDKSTEQCFYAEGVPDMICTECLVCALLGREPDQNNEE